MDIMDSSMGSEIERITSSGIGSFPYISAVIHTPVGDVEVFEILNYDVMRDYLVQYCDEATAVLVVPKGQMALRVALNPDKLEITITRSSGAVYGASNTTSQTISNRYKMILSNPVDPSLVAGQQQVLDEFTMDLQGFEYVSVQLFEPLMERFAMQTVGGIYRNTTVADVVRTILVKCSQEKGLDEDYRTTAIDMVEPDDTTVREHINLPVMPAHDAIGYIQKKAGGIYSAGVSYFYQSDRWYVFPSFDFSRFNEAPRQLMIYRVPEQRLPHIEKTTLVHGTTISIVATGEFSSKNATQNKKIEQGNGVIYSDASKLFEQGIEVKGNKAVASRAVNNNEYVSSMQSTGLNKLSVSNERITANKLQQSSVLASREGIEVQLVWHNANVDLLTPGMQTRLYFMRDGIVREAQAVLIGVQLAIVSSGTGLLNGYKQSIAAIRLWVDTKEI